MPQRVQIVGDIASVINLYTGLDRELTATTDSHELRLHDGLTAGGRRILNVETTDLRYQRRSSELDALAALDQTRGMIIRLGAAQYTTREIEGVLNETVITNPKGFAGNFVIGLAALIDKAVTFAQTVTFQNGIIVNNVTGNLTGNVTGNLTGDVAGNTVGAHDGPVDVRGESFQIDDAAIAISKLAQTPVLDGDERLLPSGIIMLWSGSVASIPSGWVICDGANGTPNLIDKFVVGASTTGARSVDDTGGAETHSHVVTIDNGGLHSHSVTVNDHTLITAEIPGHFHGMGVTSNSTTQAVNGFDAKANTDRFDNHTGDGTIEPRTTTVGGGDPHNHGASSANAGTHGHTNSVSTNNHLPPYYALAYIMKT